MVEAYGGGTGLKEYYLTGFIDGEIDEILIYRKAMNEDEVQKLYKLYN